MSSLETAQTLTLTPSWSAQLLYRLGNALLPLMGWRIENSFPNIPKFIVIVAPHTSNWDLPVGIVCAYALGLFAKWRVGYMAKSTAFVGPLAPVLKMFGGIPVNRHSPQNIVEQMVAVFKQNDHLALAITPEGTRKYTEYWKTGFYRIAVAAKVPIVLAALDYKRKAGIVGPMFYASGDIEADAPLMREFFAPMVGKFPAQVGPIIFKPDSK